MSSKVLTVGIDFMRARRPLRGYLFVMAAFVFAFAAPANASGPRPELLRAALAAQRAHHADIKHADTLAIIDYSLPSNVPRLFIVDRETGRSEAFLVAHGRGSDPTFSGRAIRFSNAANSRMSSLGVCDG